MRPITRSTLLAAVDTNGARWVVPTRLALGVLLLFPVDGSIQQRFSFHHGDPSAWLRDAVDHVIVPLGDWSCGAMYLAVALLPGDLLAAGSGRWSVDYWLAMKLKAVANPHFRR